MIYPRQEPGTPTDPLPADFPPALRSVDVRLSHWARVAAFPPSLAEEVFQASVSMLPQPVRAEARPQLRLVGAEHLFRRRMAWGRLAMAASVAIVGGIGVLLAINQPVSTPSGSSSVLVESETDPAVHFASEFDLLRYDSVAELERDIDCLLQTRKLTSTDEIVSDLALQVAALGM